MGVGLAATAKELVPLGGSHRVRAGPWERGVRRGERGLPGSRLSSHWPVGRRVTQSKKKGGRYHRRAVRAPVLNGHSRGNAGRQEGTRHAGRAEEGEGGRKQRNGAEQSRHCPPGPIFFFCPPCAAPVWYWRMHTRPPPPPCGCGARGTARHARGWSLPPPPSYCTDGTENGCCGGSGKRGRAGSTRGKTGNRRAGVRPWPRRAPWRQVLLPRLRLPPPAW